MNYGEPWRREGQKIINAQGQIVVCAYDDMFPERTVFEQGGEAQSTACLDRIVACVNARAEDR